MSRGFALSSGFFGYGGAAASAGEVPGWVLQSGFWDDALPWNDSEAWND